MPPTKHTIYQHYKGGYYAVMGIAKHYDDEDEWVVYRPILNDDVGGLFIRPRENFEEMVTPPGPDRPVLVPRFREVTDDEGLQLALDQMRSTLNAKAKEADPDDPMQQVVLNLGRHLLDKVETSLKQPRGEGSQEPSET